MFKFSFYLFELVIYKISLIIISLKQLLRYFIARKKYRNDLFELISTTEFNQLNKTESKPESSHFHKWSIILLNLFNKFLFDPPACQSRIRRDTGRQRRGLRTPNRNFRHQLSRSVSIQLCRIWKHRSSINFEKETKQF